MSNGGYLLLAFLLGVIVGAGLIMAHVIWASREMTMPEEKPDDKR